MAEETTQQQTPPPAPPPMDVGSFLSKYGMTPPPPSPEETRIIQSREKVTQGQVKALQDAAAQRKLVDGQIQQLQPPAPPRIQDMPPPPAQKKPDALASFQAFQNPGVMLALVGSLFTRAPLTAAFQAGGAAMEAFNKGEQQAYERERQKWEDAVKDAIAQNKVELERYNAVMNNQRWALDKKQAELQAIAAGVKDQTMIGALQNGDIDMQMTLLEQRRKAQTDLLKAVEMSQYHQALTDYYKSRTAAAAEQKMEDQTIDFMARQLVGGNAGVLTNLGRGVQGAQNVIAVRRRAMEIANEEGKSPTDLNNAIADYMGIRRGASALGQREAQVIGAITTAQATAPRVTEASEKIDRTVFPTLNQALLAAQKGAGGENVVRFGIAVNTLINNYARALGAGSSVLTDTARREAHELLSTAYSKGQIKAAIDQMMLEMDSELEGARRAQREFTKTHGETKPPTAAPGQPVRVQTPEEATKLAPGTKYTTPDGQEYVR